MVRHGDDQWFDIVKWTLFAMVDAENSALPKKNVDDMAKSEQARAQAGLRHRWQSRRTARPHKDWMLRIVKAVGNYGESFDRNVGTGSKLGIARGLNSALNKGGFQYAPPIADRSNRLRR